MKTLVVVVALAGCNSVFGVRGDLHERDAPPHEFFDAPIDAIAQCPPIGGPAPTFRPAVHSLPFASCRSYSISEAKHRATGDCRVDTTAFVGEGDLEGPLSAATVVDMSDTSYYYTKLSADGDHLMRSAVSTIPPDNYAIEIHDRVGDRAWAYAETLPFSDNPNFAVPPFVTNATAGPEPHIIVGDRNVVYNTTTLFEYARIGGTWQQVDTYDAAMIFDNFAAPSLSADGLRMVFTAATSVVETFYTDRAAITDRFRPAVQIVGIPPDLDFPVMSSNCGKLYFTALQTSFYLEQ